MTALLLVSIYIHTHTKFYVSRFTHSTHITGTQHLRIPCHFVLRRFVMCN